MVCLLMSGVNLEHQEDWNDITLQPIGFVSSPVTERTDENWGETRSKVVLNPEFAGALLGLEEIFPRDHCDLLASGQV